MYVNEYIYIYTYVCVYKCDVCPICIANKAGGLRVPRVTVNLRYLWQLIPSPSLRQRAGRRWISPAVFPPEIFNFLKFQETLIQQNSKNSQLNIFSSCILLWWFAADCWELQMSPGAGPCQGWQRNILWPAELSVSQMNSNLSASSKSSLAERPHGPSWVGKELMSYDELMMLMFSDKVLELAVAFGCHGWMAPFQRCGGLTMSWTPTTWFWLVRHPVAVVPSADGDCVLEEYPKESSALLAGSEFVSDNSLQLMLQYASIAICTEWSPSHLSFSECQ